MTIPLPAHHHTLLDFWKFPAGAVTFGGQPAPEQVSVRMARPCRRARLARHAWQQAEYFSANGENTPPAQIHRDTRSVELGFDLDQSVLTLLGEDYLTQEHANALLQPVRALYYLVKPVLPRRLQIAIRRRMTASVQRREFPHWPLDLSVDLLHYMVLAEILELHPARSLPVIAFWPQAAPFCYVITHDVEQAAGLENVQKITAVEQRYGLRSAWNFVPERYPIPAGFFDRLAGEGFEIGVHGLRHDGRLFANHRIFHSRAGRINQYARQWHSAGFRSPSNLRNLDWIAGELDFTYDSSCLTSERYGAQPGGCCTVFPFVYGSLVELPITLQQDFTLLEILQQTPQQAGAQWIETIEVIRQYHGMVLLNVHPDYLNTPERLAAYEGLLAYLSGAAGCWHALPRAAAQWWRARHDSTLEWEAGEWRIRGPAAGEGRVVWAALADRALHIGQQPAPA